MNQEEIELLTEEMLGHDELSRKHRKEADECCRKITELRGKCKKCNGKMILSDYIENTYAGMGDFGEHDVVTVSAGGSGKLIKNGSMKCEECGWSVTRRAY